MRTFAGLIMMFCTSSLVYGAGPAAVPEIGAASSVGAFALLSGALLVIRGRRKK